MKSSMLSTKSPLSFVSGNVLYVGKITLEFKKTPIKKDLATSLCRICMANWILDFISSLLISHLFNKDYLKNKAYMLHVKIKIHDKRNL